MNIKCLATYIFPHTISTLKTEATCWNSCYDIGIASDMLYSYMSYRNMCLFHLLVWKERKNMFFGASSRGHVVLLIIKLVVAGLFAFDQLSKRIFLGKREWQTLDISTYSSPLGFKGVMTWILICFIILIYFLMFTL